MSSRLLKNVRCRNGCAVSSIGKFGVLFGFNDSIRSGGRKIGLVRPSEQILDIKIIGPTQPFKIQEFDH